MNKNIPHSPRPIEWIPDHPPDLIPGTIRILDQTLLPCECRDIMADNPETVYEAISMLRVRGAPAIGIAAAMALVTAIQNETGTTKSLVDILNRTANRLAGSRPTAVNLFQALNRMRAAATRYAATEAHVFKETLAAEAVAIRNEDAVMCRAIGRFGADLLAGGKTFMTHCNAGSLATAEFGTALAPFYTLQAAGHAIHVYADETRPLLQGARLTAWELQQAGIPCTVICDGAAAHVMRCKGIDAVVVGADRIAANGDTANKIGTYGLALLAKAHKIPFYVCAPTTTLDTECADGNAIPIEERDAQEITSGFGKSTVPIGVPAFNPAFDVTPADAITAIITERGVLRPDYRTAIKNNALPQGKP